MVSEAFALAVRLAVRRGVRRVGSVTGHHHLTVGPWTLVFYGDTARRPEGVQPRHCVVVVRDGLPVGLVYPSGGCVLSGTGNVEDELIADMRAALYASEDVGLEPDTGGAAWTSH